MVKILTLRFLEFLNQELIGIIRFGNYKFFEEVFHEFKHLFFLEVKLNVLLIFKFLDLIHFLYFN